MPSEKWVTFDCFGTLMDWQGGFRRILATVAGPGADELVHAYHAAEAATEGDDPSRPYKDVLTLTLRRAAAAIGLALTDAQAGALVTGWGTLLPFPDTGLALAQLRTAGWKIGILTNCDDDLFDRTRANFPGPIDLLVTAQQVQSYKPGLAHFEAFEPRTGVDRARWVHAAVSWWHDMQPARTLGLRRVWVDRENSGHDPAIVTSRVEDMASLPAAIAQFGIL